MAKPLLSAHFQTRIPSSIRLAQIEFMNRLEKVAVINLAIGNVSLPMHPAMVRRMFSLNASESPFKDGVVKYSATIGEKEANQAFLHLISCSGFSIEGLHAQVTDGASHAMELLILGVCGAAGSQERPLLVFDPVYANYFSMTQRTGRNLVAMPRHLQEDGRFSLPKLTEIERTIQKTQPSAILVIPYDNPTGQFFPQPFLGEVAELCVKYNLWMVSDEAYRELFYQSGKTSSIWGTEERVPGIRGRRISLESASKVWNACGLRVGALVTDNLEFHQRAIAENTANLCSNVLGQYIFGALLHESKQELQAWFDQQRTYYRELAASLTTGLKKEMPDLIVSNPDASLYTVVDLRKLCGPQFDANEFMMFCAKKGSALVNGIDTTLLMAPMEGFYSPARSESNPGKTALRIAFVETPELMAEVPKLFAQLLRNFAFQ